MARDREPSRGGTEGPEGLRNPRSKLVTPPNGFRVADEAGSPMKA
ncbi:hypothetical protein WME97_33700 [Sorangium sp. So ce367]